MALKNHQYQALMREYDKRQSYNMHLQQQRQNEIYAKISEYAQIERSVSSVSIAHAKRMLAGDTTAKETLKGQLMELSEKKRRLLAEHGYPADYLHPVYTCEDCKDTGYIDNEKCHCFIQASIDLLYSQSNLQGILEEENFNTFRLDYYSDEVTDSVTELTARQLILRAVEESKDFIRKFAYEYQNLFFYGKPGVGKTFLTHCIAKELLESTHSVLYFSSVHLFERMKEAVFQKTDTDTNSVLEDIYNCDLLIIDDLGTEALNSYVAPQLFSCLDARDERKMPTIISTNLNLQEIRDRYSERVFSRLSSRYKVIKLIGDDIRLVKKLNQNTWRS